MDELHPNDPLGLVDAGNSIINRRRLNKRRDCHEVVT
jgi:hypothetical protein